MRIGIDVGGTHTDAVLLAADDGAAVRVLAATKTATTPDVTDGVTTATKDLLLRAAIEGVLPTGPDGTPDAAGITTVVVGTTHFINAVIRGRDVSPTAAIRLGLPATAALPPMTGWPSEIRKAIQGRYFLCHGGYEYDGSILSELRPDELKRVAAQLAAADISTVAVSSVFSPLNKEMEEAAADILRAELPHLKVSCSHQFGSVGLLERENATILNATLVDLAEHVLAALEKSLGALDFNAALLLSQNDGTVMTLDRARQFPAATFASGPTNSLCGAAFLSGLSDCAVIDVGGTTTDIGVVTGGFPRPASALTSIAGIKTNLRMPDVLSLGIGGGSHVRDIDGDVFVGPDSVGYALTHQARVFGGSILTASDLATAGGRAVIGQSRLVADLDPELVAAALRHIDERVADAVDRMRTNAETLPVVAVGGGHVLLPDQLAGIPEVLRPDHAEVANAVGAAIARIGGEVDRVFRLPDGGRQEALAEAKAEAIERAEAAGAIRGSVEVIEVEEIPLAYVPGGAARIRVKAVGAPDPQRLAERSGIEHNDPLTIRPVTIKTTRSTPDGAGIREREADGA